MNNHTAQSVGARLSKVLFELEKSDWHDHGTESMWAIPVDDNVFRLDNVPYYVYGVSYRDVISTKPVGGQNAFADVVARGGHSTYRIFLVGEESQQHFPETWKLLHKLGCSYERATDYLVAVDVPPESDIYKVYAALEEGVKLGTWDFEEGHCGHALRS
jgi:hypothetical protein